MNKKKKMWTTHKEKIFCPLLKKNCIYDKCVGFTLSKPIKENPESDEIIGINNGCKLFNKENIEITFFEFKGKIVDKDEKPKK